jgi:hypothetical protein
LLAFAGEAQVISVRVKSGFDGRYFSIDAPDEDMVKDWLMDIVRELHPNQTGYYMPIMIESYCEWEVPR